MGFGFGFGLKFFGLRVWVLLDVEVGRGWCFLQRSLMTSYCSFLLGDMIEWRDGNEI